MGFQTMITLANFFSPPSQLAQPQPKQQQQLLHLGPSFSQSYPLPKQRLNPKFATKGKPVWPTNAFAEDKEIVAAEKTGDGVEEKPSISRRIEEFRDGILANPDRLLNAAIVLGASSLAITKLLTIDHDYWQGWTFYEVLRYAPVHNWIAYEEALKAHPVLAKMAISGIVYSLGDWIAQCYEGKPLFDFDRARVLRSGLVGFALHGSISHYYYHFCEALIPSGDWWVIPVKAAIDQTIWTGVWNCIYYVVLGFLRLESPVNIFVELKSIFWPVMFAGWKLWPFAHLITYGVIPVEQRLLWVDCVELIWVTILSTYSNEKHEVRISETSEAELVSPSKQSPKE